ncbi:MAG TPA: TIGR03617 family F420-dependent LLM class oxidoreductase [Pseudonocardia sp.]|jgi:probable F420-dependent oxidoreductase
MMKVDCGVLHADPAGFARIAATLEARRYDGVWCAETRHDLSASVSLAARDTRDIQLGTSILLAFARTPMTVAITANDLQQLSGGRFVLGLGTQIKPHITRRFSMPWSRPAARMREYVLAMRAIWHSWATGDKLDHDGEFYTHTYMPPFFSPGPNPYGNPPIHLAAVGPRMTEIAGEVADGVLLHALTTRRYLMEVTLPALRRGFDLAGRDGDGFQVSCPTLIATGATEEQMAASVASVRRQIAFYGSTPAYAPVLELHGWGEIAAELNRLTKAERWDILPEVVPEEMLREIAVVAAPDELGAAVEQRLSGIAQRVLFYLIESESTDHLEPARAHLQRATAGASGPSR